MIRIITVEREYGSGAAEIAEKTAKGLGWKLWDQLLTDEIARRMDCPGREVEEHEERRDPVFYRLMKSFMRGSHEGSQNAARFKMVDTDCVRDLARQIVSEIAETGNSVMVGRGSAYYLGGRRDTFHVFIYAPFEDKVRRLRARGESEREATDLAESVDRDRADFIRRYFGVEWPDRHRFHLMINSTLGDEVAVETILNGAGLLQKQSV